MNDQSKFKNWVLSKINRPEIDFGDARVFASRSFEERYNSYIKYVLSFARREGIWLEFGVSSGETTKKYVDFMDESQNHYMDLIHFLAFQRNGLNMRWGNSPWTAKYQRLREPK
jgi:hypothetical protein